MAEVILMPKLSDTMTEGVVAEWHKKIGDDVESGELLAEIETDKATMEFESFYDGKLLYIGVEKGQGAPVNDILAIIGDEGEDVDQLIEENKAKDSSNDESAEETPEPDTEDLKTKKEEPKENEKNVKTSSSSNQDKTSSSSSDNGTRIFASPLAKKLAEEKNIDLNDVEGSGENGRIVKRDIESYKPEDRPKNSAKSKSSSNGGNVLTESYTDENISQMRKTIAKRLAESKFSAPHFYLTLEIDMDNAITARKAVNANDGVRISFNDMVIKACAVALKKHPNVNSAWMGDKIRRYDHVNIGVAVAVEEGLLVPVVRFADSKGLMEIGSEVKEYAQKAKDKKLQPEDWEGNTFTISNLGMYNIEEFTAIINPPDSCILAIGGIKQVPVVKDGQVVPGNIMKVTLSCDHRVVDGVTGAEFLNTFKSYMENPMMMLV
ncbi:pyruvate dehydrogenase complex dihydrolipoamide acetyltransferase [Brumimicrobium salinarum]|uniref:Acetyltransferase component of pyruvate dehydrogenase complex n=1 Tax=Brumimicrobium salinarum TaxID=2058658 RepID=A0A2I0R3A5_9FLAO|nr:pyruvate dehydrogenase complex dihydrolipoamide acetyltransferase [Brumimicrobium salinarum]PKR81061.1 pyruvate dehydrogenase complex dihydrolipoamide acetyltransferase [Brumimicrobium salinarum]